MSSIAKMCFAPVPCATLVAVALLMAATPAESALTTDKCLAAKRTAWITLRKCQGAEQVKQIKGKPADLAKCDTKFQEKLTSIGAKATKAGVACRYRDNGDGTVTDFQTGLMWEQKTGEVGGLCFITPTEPHCVNILYRFDAATSFVNQFLNGLSEDGVAIQTPFAGHSDWRLPTIVELSTILDVNAPGGCGNGSVCIDPVFGPTNFGYWSSTTYTTETSSAWIVRFDGESIIDSDKYGNAWVRAVRGAL